MEPPLDLASLLDARGLLRADAALPSLALPEAYAVFVQGAGARLDAGALERAATRFFSARFGLGQAKRYGDVPPREDVASLYWDADDGASRGARLAVGRPATETDHDAALRVEARDGLRGLSDLARRCPTLWLVQVEADAPDGDRVALGLAAVLATVGLGPILDPAGAIYGVRGARERLERGRPAPYR